MARLLVLALLLAAVSTVTADTAKQSTKSMSMPTTSEATTSEAATSEATTSEATTSEATTSEATTSEATTTTTATPDEASLVVMSDCNKTCGTCASKGKYQNSGECIHDTEKKTPFSWYKATCTDSDYTITEFTADNCGGKGKEYKGKVGCSSTYQLGKLVMKSGAVTLQWCTNATSPATTDVCPKTCDKGDHVLDSLDGACTLISRDGKPLYTYKGTHTGGKITLDYYGAAENCVNYLPLFSVQDASPDTCVIISQKHMTATCTNNGSSSAQLFFLVTLVAVLVSLLA